MWSVTFFYKVQTGQINISSFSSSSWTSIINNTIANRANLIIFFNIFLWGTERWSISNNKRRSEVLLSWNNSINVWRTEKRNLPLQSDNIEIRIKIHKLASFFNIWGEDLLLFTLFTCLGLLPSSWLLLLTTFRSLYSPTFFTCPLHVGWDTTRDLSNSWEAELSFTLFTCLGLLSSFWSLLLTTFRQLYFWKLSSDVSLSSASIGDYLETVGVLRNLRPVCQTKQYLWKLNPLAWSEIQPASTKIWSRFVVSIPYYDNCYSTFLLQIKHMHK